MKDFENKSVLVTGGNSGIGKAAALLFARRGARVAVAARRDAEVHAVVDEIKAAGGTAIGIPTDISDPVQIATMVESVAKEFGRLDAAFNNAGIMGRWDAIDALTVEDFDQAISVNLRGTWLCIQAEVAQMKRQGTGGAIVNTSSWLAQGALRGSALYSMTKAGLDSLVKALTFECSDSGIRVNNVAPGVVDTPMTSGNTDEALLATFVAQTPMKRMSTPEEIAEAAVWLCSPGAGFVTGQTLLVDGGYTIPGIRV